MAGDIFSADLTVVNAEEARDFYAAVVGWKAVGLDMGGYDDFVMQRDEDTPVAGICHARGVNADMPPQWLIYVTVDDIERSLAECSAHGGEQVTPIKGEPGETRYAVIRDPAGAVMALLERGTEAPDVPGEGSAEG